jgi:hypothetical protein
VVYCSFADLPDERRAAEHAWRVQHDHGDVGICGRGSVLNAEDAFVTTWDS